MAQRLICMTEKELFRYETINSLINKEINGTDASKLIEVSVRHIKRLKCIVIKNGAQGLIHKNRGKESNRKTDDKILQKAKEHIKEKYYDFGPTFAVEKLEEDDKIKLSKQTDKKLPQIFSIQEIRKVNNDYTIMFKNQFFQLE